MFGFSQKWSPSDAARGSEAGPPCVRRQEVSIGIIVPPYFFQVQREAFDGCYAGYHNALTWFPLSFFAIIPRYFPSGILLHGVLLKFDPGYTSSCNRSQPPSSRQRFSFLRPQGDEVEIPRPSDAWAPNRCSRFFFLSTFPLSLVVFCQSVFFRKARLTPANFSFIPPLRWAHCC